MKKPIIVPRKFTHSKCTLDECHYNAISPVEDVQECIGCPYRTKRGKGK